MMLEELKVSCANVNSLNNFKYNALRDIVKQVDIFCMVDTKQKVNDQFRYRYANKTTFSAPSENNRSKGIMIFFNKDLNPTFNVIVTGQLVSMCFEKNNKKFKINIVYGPPDSDNPDFFSKIPQHNIVDPEEYIVHIGDWNVVQSTRHDRKPNENTYYKPKSNTAIRNMCHDHELIDPWRDRNPYEKLYSWTQYNESRHSRIDYALLNADSYSILSEVNYSELPFKADHKMINISFELDRYQQGQGYFRVKNSLYYDSAFISKVNQMIDDTLATSTKQPQDILETIIFNTSTIARHHLEETKLNKLAERRFLVNEIRVYENYVHNSPDINPEDQKTLHTLQSDLEELNLADNYEKIRQNRVSDLTNPQRPSKEFKPPPLNTKKKFTEIFSESQPEKLLTNQAEAEEEVYKYFKKLYKQEPQKGDFEQFVDFPLPQVTKTENENLTKIVTTEEVAEFIKHTNHNKAPGITGETTGFFKCFWVKIKNLVTNAINNTLSIQMLPKRQKIGIICLIPKQDKDPRKIGNLRPITLLSTFYKIISGIITNRLKPILDRLIRDWQKAYLPGRFIGEVTRSTYDVFASAKANNLPGILLLVDFSKAFDSISFSFIEKTLRAYGFSEEIIGWINILLLDFESVTCLNGNSSSRIPLERGCRQGDPIAGYMFILCLEILLIKISKDNLIKPWVSKKGHAHLIDGYADDLNIFLSSSSKEQSETMLNRLLGIFQAFKEISGLTINISKTKYVMFGPTRKHIQPSNTPFEKLKEDHFKLLGIKLNPKLTKLEINWNDAIDKARKETYKWKDVKTSIFGRVNIVKACLLAKFNHIATIIPQPNKKIYAEIENLIINFLNNSKRHIYPKALIFKPCEAGGLGIPIVSHFWLALATSWLKRITTSKSFWLTLLGENIRTKPNLLCNLSTFCLTHETLTKGTNDFWDIVLNRWDETFKKLRTKNPSLLLAETIDRNPYLTGSPISIAKNRIFAPLQTLIDSNYELLPLEKIKEKYPEIKIIDYTYNAIKLATEALLANLKAWSIPKNPHEKQNFLKQTITYSPTLPAFPNILNFTKFSQKGCKAIRQTMALDHGTKDLWKCFDKIEQKLGINLEPEEKTYSIKNIVKADRLLFAKELKLQVIRNVYLNGSILYNIGVLDSNLCTHCSKKDDNIHHFYECLQVKHVWKILTEILNLTGNYIYIDTKTALLGLDSLPSNDYRNLLIDFTRHEIKIAKISNKVLSKERLIGRLTDLSIAMKTFGYQKKQWENIFYILSFNKIEDNYETQNSGKVILINNTQSSSGNRNLGELSEQYLTWAQQIPEHTASQELPKTFSYLKRASEPLSKFIKLSARYGFLY